MLLTIPLTAFAAFIFGGQWKQFTDAREDRVIVLESDLEPLTQIVCKNLIESNELLREQAEEAESLKRPWLAEKDVVHKASWYNYDLSGAPGYSTYTATCASRDYPRKTMLQVKNVQTTATVVCRVNDYVENPDVAIDLSSFAFEQIADLSLGVIEVYISEVK